MMTDDWLHKALDIKAPWQISHVVEDVGSRRVDLWVSLPRPRTGWFFSQRPSAPDRGCVETQSYRLRRRGCWYEC